MLIHRICFWLQLLGSCHIGNFFTISQENDEINSFSLMVITDWPFALIYKLVLILWHQNDWREHRKIIVLIKYYTQRTLTIEGRITVRLVASVARLDLAIEENMLFFVCCGAAESKLVKLETSHTIILPQIVSVLSYTLFMNDIASLFLVVRLCSITTILPLCSNAVNRKEGRKVKAVLRNSITSCSRCSSITLQKYGPNKFSERGRHHLKLGHATPPSDSWHKQILSPK